MISQLLSKLHTVVHTLLILFTGATPSTHALPLLPTLCRAFRPGRAA